MAIVYKDTVSQFKMDVLMNEVSNKVLTLLKEKHLSGGSESEFRSWENSLNYMKNVLDVSNIDGDKSI